MKSQTTRGAFSPLMLMIETPEEYDAVMLGMRMGADGLRAMLRNAKDNSEGFKLGRAADLLDHARECLDHPEVTR